MLVVLDSSVLVDLIEAGLLANLRLVQDCEFVVPDIVDDEMTSSAARSRHASDVATYESARSSGLIRVEALNPGTPGFAKYMELRSTRTSPLKNRGEDACLALAFMHSESAFCTADRGREVRIAAELGGRSRVWSLSHLLSLLTG